jgi:hypothetical protein
MRGYRPSTLAEQDQQDEEAAVARQANMELYAMRAQMGLPLFEKQPPPKPSTTSAA